MMTKEEMDAGDDAVAEAVIHLIMDWLQKARPDLSPAQLLQQGSRLLLGMSEMMASGEVLGRADA